MIELVYLSSTLMRWRQYITHLGASYNAAMGVILQEVMNLGRKA
jgi:hypothetical protein